MKTSAWIAGLVVACGMSAVRAGEGRIPVFGTTVINGPGHYVVTRDISTAGPSPVITIGGAGCAPFNGVTLDLNGHTLAKADAVDVVRIDTLCIKRGVTIRNGRMVGPATGSGTGAGILSTADGQIEIRIEDVQIESVGGSGIEIGAARVVDFKNCHIHGAGAGIVVFGGAGPFSGSIVGNTIDSTQSGGLYLAGLNGGQVKGNVITNFGLDSFVSSGIVLVSQTVIGDIVGGNLVEGNTVSSQPGGTNDRGLLIQGTSGFSNSHNRVVGNTFQRNGAEGAWIQSNGNWIERNTLSKNGISGILIGTASTGFYDHLEGNSAHENGECGFRIVITSHSYRNNIGSGNGLVSPSCIHAGTVDLGGNIGL